MIYVHNKGTESPDLGGKNMKYADCNARQKKAFRNIYHASNWLLGGLENTMLDNPEGSEEYESAKATLANHDGLVAELYRMATTDLYDDGSCCFNQAAERYLKDIRFCGKEWLVALCEARIKKAGY